MMLNLYHVLKLSVIAIVVARQMQDDESCKQIQWEWILHPNFESPSCMPTYFKASHEAYKYNPAFLAPKYSNQQQNIKDDKTIEEEFPQSTQQQINTR